MPPADEQPLLLPEPRRWELLGAWLDVPPRDALDWRAPIGLDVNLALGEVARGRRRGVDQPAWLECRLDSSRPRDPRTTAGQSYLLKATPAEHGPSCTVTSGTIEGLRLGLATLRQLLVRYERALPAVLISDEPGFATRGVMLDVSRCRVPTIDELLRIADWVASLKGNHLQLYTEHTFAYAGHPDAWRDSSPITPEDVRRLDAHCAARGIALAANQNCFGHLAHWLRLPKYQHLAETHGDWVFDVWPRRGPFSLCPTDPASLEFVRGLLGELLPCFTAPLVNIGCDETFDVGFGRSKDEVAKRGRAAVYMDFVTSVAGVARALGKRPMFWADIALSQPDALASIPPDLISLAWGYEPDSPFENWARALAGREFWVCPGTASWRSITGRTMERTGNISAATSAGARGGATGVLVCDWGDTGHHQQWPVAAHGIAHGLAAAWNPREEPDMHAVSLHAHGDRSLAVGSWLEALGNADLPLRRTCLELSRAVTPGGSTKLLNQTALFIDLFKKLDEQTHVGVVSDWSAGREAISTLSDSLPPSLDPQTTEELRHTLAYAAFAADRGLGRRSGRGGDSAWRTMMRGRVDELAQEHRRLWLRRSREGGLTQSLGYFTQIAELFS